MLSLGPLPWPVIVVALAALVAWLAARAIAGRWTGASSPQAGSLLVDSLIVGLLAARLGFIAQWWPEYATRPLSVLSIGDGGFLWWLGVPVAAAFAWWRTRQTMVLRKPVLIAMAAGLAAWAGINGVAHVLQQSAPPLPPVALLDLQGESRQLSDFAGQPVVVNLWATWCPPCRREMPALQQAQSAFPGVAIVLANQGEGAPTVHEYLSREGLTLDNVLLDPGSSVSRDMSVRGYPTTLFFNAEGRMVDMHVGEITLARFSDIVRRRFGAAAEGGNVR